MTNDEQQTTNIDDIRARLAAATPGPWEVSAGTERYRSNAYRYRCYIWQHKGRMIATMDPSGDHIDADAAFIAHAPADIALLLAERDALVIALMDMAGQYLAYPDGTMSHTFMSAGENALELLERLGLVVNDGHERYTWTEKAKELDR